MAKFNKLPLSLPEQVEKLRSRGLKIPDAAKAESALLRIGYYRLSGYTLPFQQAHLPDKPFVNGAELEDVLALYSFDCELRSLVLSALERIEIALRSAITNHMCIHHGAHWYMDRLHFAPLQPTFSHDDLIDRIEDDLEIPSEAKAPSRLHSEVFINHYYKKYGDPYLPPAWMVWETLSLVTCSMIFANLSSTADKNAIASNFGYDQAILAPWLHTLAYVRNICAHHRRLWNRKLVIKATTPKKHSAALRITSSNRDRFYAVAVVIFDLLRAVAPGYQWNKRLVATISHYPLMKKKLGEAGFPVPWKNDEFWELKEANDPACWI